MRPLLLMSLSLGLVLATNYDFGLDIERLTRRTDSERIIVGRLPFAANGSVPHRLEIRQMRNDPYKWNLFILALSMFQSVDQSDPLSWYQVAGVHGVPFRTWNGVEPAPGGNMSGYCTHSSVLFPIWHRPYLALVEQELYRLASFIAGMFFDRTERELYQRAASDIRLPYWDWAVPPPYGQTHFPDVFSFPTLKQYGPRGYQVIRNPLYSYPFNPVEEDAFIWSPLKEWGETKRAPATNISLAAPPSMNQRVNEALLMKLPEIQQRLFILFSSYKDFNSFGNKAWAVSQNQSSWDSIEAIHDIIHIYGGLRGHMTYVPLSSFDPLFFIHHVSTDRFISMWQTLNPTSWMSPMAAGETSYNTVKGDIQNSNTPLTPFYISEDGQFWTSDMARDTRIFGYTYADTDPAMANGQNLQGVLSEKIRFWYGASSAISLKESDESPVLHPHEVRDATGNFFGLKTARPNLHASAKSPPIHSVIKSGRYTEWIANVHTNVEALDGTFSIHFFIGQAPPDCKHWDTSPNQIGSVDIFAMNRMTGSQSKISGALPLTSALTKIIAVGDVPNLDPHFVKPFLAETLQFMVCGSDDEEVEPADVEGLYIKVTSSDVAVPESRKKLPQWGPMVTRLELWS